MVRFGIWAIAAYLFAAFSRLSEVIASLLDVVVRLPMLLLALAIAGTVFHPALAQALRNRIGFILSVLSVWFALCVPFSFHRGGSVHFLMSYWLTTFLVCACVMVLCQDLSTIRRMLYAIVSGVLLVVILSVAGTSYPALQSALGGMQNPNLYGQQLLYTLPVFFLPIFRHGLISLRGMTAAGAALLLLSKVVFTGSRASLIATGLLIILVFFQVSVAKKLGMLIASVPIIALILLLMPDLAWQRYATILKSDTSQAQTGEALSAIESANVRKIHFQQSIDLTILHPVFGVGPGMFAAASADYSQELGERAFWKETHNSYTQISSETGILGLILYVIMLGMTIMMQLKLRRLARGAPEGSVLAECGFTGFILLVSTLVTLITGNFSSVAYQLYFPLLGALSVALLHVTARERAAIQKMPPPTPNPRNTPGINSQRDPGRPTYV